MARFETRTLFGSKVTGKSAGDIVQINLPTDFYIQQIFIDVAGTIDTGGSVTKASLGDFKQVKRVRVYGNIKTLGSVNLVDISGVQLHLLNLFDYRKFSYYLLPTTTSQTDLATRWCTNIDFRINPYQPLDVSAMIPAFEFDSLILELTLGSASDLGSGYSNFDGIWVLPTIVEYIPSSKAEVPKLQYRLNLRSEEYPLSASVDNQIDLATGEVIDRLMLLTRTTAGTYQVILDRFSAKLGERVDIIPETDWNHAVNEDKRLYQTVDTHPIYAVMNELGFNARPYKKGDIKLHAWCGATGGYIELVYKTYL